MIRLNKVDNFKTNFHHDQNDDHPLESHVVLVIQVRHENVHQITAQAQLLVHHLAKKPIKE
jgi:hypothetical protein